MFIFICKLFLDEFVEFLWFCQFFAPDRIRLNVPRVFVGLVALFIFNKFSNGYVSLQQTVYLVKGMLQCLIFRTYFVNMELTSAATEE